MFKVIDNKSKANGTSYKGCIITTYDKLVELLGEPLEGSADNKTTCEWILEFDTGDIVTIHDWKSKTTPKNLYNWSVGGRNYKAVNLLEQAIKIPIHATYF